MPVPADAAATDVALSTGRIVACRPAGRAPLAVGDIDGGGQLLLPPLVESHCHLDKTLWGLPWRPNSAGPTLKDYIANERRVLREVEVPIAARAGALLEQCIARGSLTFRCHVDVDPELGLRHVEAMLALRGGVGRLVPRHFVQGDAVQVVWRLEHGLLLVDDMPECQRGEVDTSDGTAG